MKFIINLSVTDRLHAVSLAIRPLFVLINIKTSLMWPTESNWLRTTFLQEKPKQKHLETLVVSCNQRKCDMICVEKYMYVKTSMEKYVKM